MLFKYILKIIAIVSDIVVLVIEFIEDINK